MKKIITFALALIFILGLSVSAFAADVNVTINDSSAYAGDRSYAAYMLMTASVDSTDVNFSYTVNAKYAAVLKTALGLAPTATDDDIINTLRGIADRSEQMHHVSDALYRAIQEDPALTPEKEWTGDTTQLTQAYWLIVDTTDLSGTEFANSLVMVDTIGNNDVTITNKPKSTTSSKKIDDENDSLLYPVSGNEDAANWQDVADYDIGDQVPYSIRITCANDIAEYDYFSFVMMDRVEEGLTYLENSFVLYVNGVAQPAGTLVKKGSAGEATAKFLYEIETDEAGGKQTAQRLYVYPNFDYTPDGEPTVEANKTNGGDFLQFFPAGTDHAQINNSTIRLDYKCLLNENAVHGVDGNPNVYTLKFSNNPYDYTSYGKTPDDTALVLTYKVTVNKVDTNGNALTGAQFSLYKFYAEDKGTLTDAEALAAGFVHHSGANSWGKFVKVDTVTVNAAGDVFSFNGLDDGYYKLEEDLAPAGYNKIDPIEFRIEANHIVEMGGGVVLTQLTGTTKIGGELVFTSDTGAGSLTTNVENHTGSELPSTGGIGTTIFYILGSIMVMGATVILVTKKRMAT